MRWVYDFQDEYLKYVSYFTVNGDIVLCRTLYCVDYLNEIKSIKQWIDVVACPHCYTCLITLDVHFNFLQFPQYE